MKYLRIFMTSGILCILVLSAPSAIHATSISFGPTVWFTWWDPFYKDDLSYTYNAQVHPLNRHINKKFYITPAFLYGPVISIDFFKRWAVSGIYMMSDRYKGKRSDADFDSEYAIDAVAKSYFTVYKSDLDASLSCRITEWLKIFVGFKWQKYDFRERINILKRGLSGDLDTDHGNSNGFGAGLGLGTAIPIVDNLQVLANMSGLYMRTTVEVRSEQIHIATLGAITPRLYLEKERFNIYGGNANVSLAYFITAISTTITAGYRYQFLQYHTDSIKNNLYAVGYSPETTMISQMTYTLVRGRGYNHTWDHFHGLIFSAIYTIEIGGNKNKEL